MDLLLPPFSEPVKALIDKYESGKITAIYGNAASGKTTCCLLASIACAKSKGKVIFIDTENTFNIERLKQLYYGEVNDILDSIFLMQPKSFEEQTDAVLKAKRLCEKDSIKLVIIDTASHHYRNVVNQNHEEINKAMAEQMADVVRIARDFNKVVIMTNQVSARVDGIDEMKMVGGKMVENMCKIIIELNKKGSKRYATLVKHKLSDISSFYKVGKKVEFEIRENGLFLTG